MLRTPKWFLVKKRKKNKKQVQICCAIFENTVCVWMFLYRNWFPVYFFKIFTNSVCDSIKLLKIINLKVWLDSHLLYISSKERMANIMKQSLLLRNINGFCYPTISKLCLKKASNGNICWLASFIPLFDREPSDI